MTNLLTAASLVFLTANSPAPVASRSTAQAQAEAPAQAQAQDQPDAPSDRRVDPSQPDFTIIGLPTTLKIPRFASAFRVTHRFTRALGAGDFGDLAADFFGFDAGAQIGIHRTSDRTIEFFAQQHLIEQGQSPVGVDLIATAEGTNNFRDSYSPAVGAVLSRTLGRHGALYAHPIWINNTNELSSEIVDDNNTFIVGLGARLRVRPTVYLVGEMIPRFGNTPNATHASFGIEKRSGGHSFQINFSNGFGTTMAQLARGGVASDTWYIGFNISRKFF